MRVAPYSLAAALLAATAVAAGTYQGRVVGVSDGDTITVLVSNREPHKVRLLDIDCPEAHQPYGDKAKLLTSGLCYGKQVTVLVTGRDRYGRDLGAVTLPGGQSLNLLVVDAGMAWWYAPVSTNASIRAAEDRARASRRGLWVGSSPQPPWVWRKGEPSK